MAQRISLLQRPLFWLAAFQGLLIIFAIYRENGFIQQLYHVQRAEQTLQALTNERKQLYHKLQKMKLSSTIKSYALHTLQLQPIKLSAIRLLYNDQQAS